MLEAFGHFHPVFIHFPLGLLLAGGLFSLGSRLVRHEGTRNAFQAAGTWNFRLGTLALVPALLTGWAAYQTVAHDAPSHAAMTLHRNWALATGTVFLGLAALAWRERGKGWPSGWLVGSVLLTGLALLGITGFLGGNLVYRFGLGVQSLPASEGDGPAHGSEGHPHGEGPDGKDSKPPVPDETPTNTTPKPHPHDGTPHKH